MEKLIDISSYPVVDVLDLLLQDKSTKKNIIWATDTYEEFGEGFSDRAYRSHWRHRHSGPEKRQRCLHRRGCVIG